MLHDDCSSGVWLCDRCSRGRRRAQAQTKGPTAKGWTRPRSVIAFMGEPAHSLLEQSHSSENRPLLYPCLSFHKVKRSVLCGIGAVTKSDLDGDTTPRTVDTAPAPQDLVNLLNVWSIHQRHLSSLACTLLYTLFFHV